LVATVRSGSRAHDGRRAQVITLCIRYTFNPDKLADIRTYFETELGPIQRSGGKVLGYFLPTDFAGATNEAMGLIDFESLADYEHYRGVLASDPDHKENISRLLQSSTGVVMSRSIIRRVSQA
jgi:NIPSNAP protein